MYIYRDRERERERLKMTCVYWKLSVQSDPVLDRVYVCLRDVHGMQIGDDELTHEKKWSFQILGGFYKWWYPPKWRFYNEKSD